MKYKSQVFTQASGSIGGITYSHNKGGLYTRARSIPTNPNTPAQQSARTSMANLVTAWSDELTAAQRTAWATYAANVPLPDAFGDPINVTGLNMYVRSNVPRLRIGATRIDAGPTDFTLPSLAAVVLTATVLGTDIGVAYDDTAAWVDVDEAHLIIQQSRPQNATINFFKAPFIFLNKVDGDSVTAPTSPSTATSLFGFVAGQKVFARVSLSLADGRLSAAQIVSDIAS